MSKRQAAAVEHVECIECGASFRRGADAGHKTMCMACWVAGRPAILVARGYAGNPDAFRVLVALATFADDDGYARPAIATLARYADCSTSKVVRDLGRLADREADGGAWIALAGPRTGGRKLATRWRIDTLKLKANVATRKENPDASVTLSTEKGGVAMTPFPTEKGGAETPKGCHADPERVASDPQKGGVATPPEAVELLELQEAERDARAKREPARKPKPARCSLSTAIEIDPELLPRCLNAAPEVRPDLTAEQVKASLERWKHDRIAKGELRADWTADFKGWLCREQPARASSIDVLTGRDRPASNAPTHPSHIIIDGAAETIPDPAPLPPELTARLEQFVGRINGHNPAPVTPPADAGIAPEDVMPKQKPPIPVETPEAREEANRARQAEAHAREEASRARQAALLAERGINVMPLSRYTKPQGNA